MKDIQSLPDNRGIALQKVGVTDIHLPFLIKAKNGAYQSVLASIRLTVGLPNEFKGTHMSRFIEVLHEWSQKPIYAKEVGQILKDITTRLEAKQADIDMRFKYFIEKTAPVSGLKSVLDYDCLFMGSMSEGDNFEFVLGMSVPCTSLCPCSKEISKYGAHNQRSIVDVKLKHQPNQYIWLEDLVALVEAQASAPIYPLLKREDEKYVTELAYDNPKFVEDIIRDIVTAFRRHPDIIWFDVECTNFESIHNHNAYARHSETK